MNSMNTMNGRVPPSNVHTVHNGYLLSPADSNRLVPDSDQRLRRRLRGGLERRAQVLVDGERFVVVLWVRVQIGAGDVRRRFVVLEAIVEPLVLREHVVVADSLVTEHQV